MQLAVSQLRPIQLSRKFHGWYPMISAMENGQEEYRTYDSRERLLVDAPVLCTWHHFPTLPNATLPLSPSLCPFPSLFRDEGTKGEDGLNQRVEGLTRQRCQRVEIYGVFSTVRRNLAG